MPSRQPWHAVSRELVDCAMGRVPADIVIQHGRWACVQTGEIIPDTDNEYAKKPEYETAGRDMVWKGARN